MPEVDLGVVSSLSGAVEEFGDQRERVAILFADPVEGSKVYAEAERAILLTDEEDGCSVGGGRLPDESGVEVLVEEFS